VCFQVPHIYSSTKTSLKEYDEKDRRNKSLGEESNTMSDPTDHSRNFTISFEKLYQTSGLTVEQKE
jgi:hypothetical protein